MRRSTARKKRAADTSMLDAGAAAIASARPRAVPRRRGVDVFFASSVVFDPQPDPALRGKALLCEPSPGYEARADGLRAGTYLADWWFFNAGSARTAGAFRGWLCRAAIGADVDAVFSSPSSFAGRPFVELLDFDETGLIGPRTASKLASDFEGWIVPPYPATPRTYSEIYRSFARAFHQGSQGLVMLKERDDG